MYSGVQVVDVGNPRQPAPVGGYSFAQSVAISDICTSGSHMYLAADIQGLLVADIGNPQAPAVVGSLAIPVRARGVSVSGTNAYVAARGGTFYVVDIGNPAAPSIEGSVTDSRVFLASGVHVSGSRAYVAAGTPTAGVVVIDISNPRSPLIVGTVTKKGVPTPGPFDPPDVLIAEGVYVSGSVAYVADDGGLQITNISDLRNPRLLGSVAIAGGAPGVYVSGPYAYVTTSGSGSRLYVFDVPTFTGPTASEPSVSISLNQSQFQAGDTTALALTTFPGTGDNDWDLYVGLILPDGTLGFMTYEPGLGFSLAPAAAGP